MDKFKFILNIIFTLILALFLLTITVSTAFNLHRLITDSQSIDQVMGEQVRCFTWRDSISCIYDPEAKTEEN